MPFQRTMSVDELRRRNEASSAEAEQDRQEESDERE